MPDNGIFQGAPCAHIRGAVCDLIRSGAYDKYIVPFAGQFAVAETFVDCGVSPKAIETGDITLFSSLLGYYISGCDLRDLDVRIDGVRMEPTTVGVAEVMYLYKLGGIKPKTYYNQQLIKDLESRKTEHIDRLVSRLENMKAKMGGLHYEIADVRDVINQYVEPDILMYLDPPIDTKSYVWMFDRDVLQWNMPHIDQFDTTIEIPKILSILEESSVGAILHTRPKNRIDWDLDKWQCTFATQSTKKNIEFLYMNQNVAAHVAASRRRITSPVGAIYPLITDGDPITEDSVVQIISIDRTTAMYYRDLFVHIFPTDSGAERFFLMLVDGKVFSVRGLIYYVQNRGNGDRVRETFGLVYQTKQSHHIGRLAMRLITSFEFRDLLTSKNEIFTKKYITSSTISRYPIAREDEGIFEMYDRVQKEDGLWHMQHEAAFNEKTYQQHLNDWLHEEKTKYGDRKAKRKRHRAATRA